MSRDEKLKAASFSIPDLLELMNYWNRVNHEALLQRAKEDNLYLEGAMAGVDQCVRGVRSMIDRHLEEM